MGRNAVIETADPGRRVLYSALVLAAAIVAMLGAQAWFLFQADDMTSPAGFYLAANMLVVAAMSFAAAAAPGCAKKARRPLIATGVVFTLLLAHELFWTAESTLEDAVTLVLWAFGAVALTVVVRLPATPPLVRRLLILAVALQGLAVAADLMDDDALGLSSDDVVLDWLYLAGTLFSMAAYQVALLNIVARGGLGATVRHVKAFVADGGAASLRALDATSDASFQKWRRANPAGDYSQFYARRIEAHLDRGLSHKTLGGRAYMSEGLGGDARAMAQEEFRAGGAQHFEWFRARALRRDMTCVDFGCGSLRVGQHFIRHLEPGRYVGLDVIDRFYREGVKLIEPETLALKRPHLGTIGADELARAAALKPDLVYSTAVLQHVPPEELEGYFEKLLGLISDNGIVVANFKVAGAMARTGMSNWVHEPSRLFDVAARVDPRVHAIILDGRGASISDQATLVVARDPGLLADWARRPDRA